jgi:hypothetical protein
MIKITCLVALLLIVLCWSMARAQDRIMDTLTTKIIQKYQQSSCEQLSKQKSEPKSPKEQEFIQMLRNDPQMRTAFINKVAAPIANKLFECGMIP